MNTIKCSGTDCPAVFQTEEPVAKNATYTCPRHTGQAPNASRFQRYAHDRKLGKSAGKKPAHE